MIKVTMNYEVGCFEAAYTNATTFSSINAIAHEVRSLVSLRHMVTIVTTEKESKFFLNVRKLILKA